MKAAYVLPLLLLGCRPAPGTAPEPLRVAAAADLSLAFEEIGALYRAETGQSLSLSFGSTGLLAKQIGEGGPFDVFAAANVSFVDQVIGAGRCDPSTKTLYAVGRVALWAKDPALLPGRIEELKDPRFRRVALANPEHAPYGKAAKQALTSVGIFAAVESRLIPGENVRAALRYAETGDVDVALVSLSLTINKKDGSSLAIDGALHEPLDQAMVVCKRGKRGKDALAFAAFVASPAGREIMRRYGFLLPGEAISIKP